MKLSDNLYAYIWTGAGNNSNSYLIAGEVLTLIDPGMVLDELGEDCLSYLLQGLEQDGFKADDIDLIINTHTHPDHCLANQPLLQRSQAKLAYHRAEQQDMERIFHMFMGKGPDFEADFYLTEGELELGVKNKIKLQVLHTPGHSQGSISLYWPEAKALITGDAVFASSVGRVDLPGGSLSQLKESIESLSELDVEYLLPGHMDLLKGRDKVQRNYRYIRQIFF